MTQPKEPPLSLRLRPEVRTRFDKFTEDASMSRAGAAAFLIEAGLDAEAPGAKKSAEVPAGKSSPRPSEKVSGLVPGPRLKSLADIDREKQESVALWNRLKPTGKKS